VFLPSHILRIIVKSTVPSLLLLFVVTFSPSLNFSSSSQGYSQISVSYNTAYAKKQGVSDSAAGGKAGGSMLSKVLKTLRTGLLAGLLMGLTFVLLYLVLLCVFTAVYLAYVKKVLKGLSAVLDGLTSQLGAFTATLATPAIKAPNYIGSGASSFVKNRLKPPAHSSKELSQSGKTAVPTVEGQGENTNEVTPAIDNSQLAQKGVKPLN